MRALPVSRWPLRVSVCDLRGEFRVFLAMNIGDVPIDTGVARGHSERRADRE